MSPRHKVSVSVSMGFLLLVGWFVAANGWRLLLTVLVAATMHELGHCFALRCFGGAVHRLHIGIFGMVLEVDSFRLSYGRELCCVLAGPATNALCVFFAAFLWENPPLLFMGANTVLCLFNLLPIRPLDGGRALELLLTWTLGQRAGEWGSRVIGACGSTLLAGGVLWLMWCSGGSLWLLPAAAGFLGIAWQESFGKYRFL